MLRGVRLSEAAHAWAVAVTRRHSRFGYWVMRGLSPGWRAYVEVYAYFRWADDRVDAPGRDPRAVQAFVADQARLWRGERDATELPEVALVRALDRYPALSGAVHRMGEALTFDAHRDARPLPARDLDAQVERVGDAYLAALWACGGESGPPPEGLSGLSRAATRAHLLRDRELDEALGYVNRPPGPDGAPIPVAAWTAALVARARAEAATGHAALRRVPWGRTRVLLGLWAWRYARLLERLTRGRG